MNDDKQAVYKFQFYGGSIYVPFEENFRISLKNYFAGRPLDEGWLPSCYVQPSDLSPVTA